MHVANVFNPHLEHLQVISNQEPENYLGRVWVFGRPHHLFLVRVIVENDILMAVCDPYKRLDDAIAGDDGLPDTVQVPGLPGTYVCYIQPYRD